MAKRFSARRARARIKVAPMNRLSHSRRCLGSDMNGLVLIFQPRFLLKIGYNKCRFGCILPPPALKRGSVLTARTGRTP
jgi:hypothetical protein